MSAIPSSGSYKYPAGALAVLVHALFFLMLYLSFSWQMKPPQGMVVEIWDTLPNEVEAAVPVVLPVPVQPEKIQDKQDVATPPPAPENADIELKSKIKKIKEERQRAERLAAQKLAEKRAEQAERRMEEVERQAQARLKAQHKAQEQAAIAAGKVVDEYIGKIAAKIRRYIVLPPGVSRNIKSEFNVTLLPSGEVLTASLSRSSGNDVYDSAVERAILKAQPLPLPPVEQGLFNRFRELHLKFSPAESGK